MEIFLLFVVIILLVIFSINSNSKIAVLQSEILKLQKFINDFRNATMNQTLIQPAKTEIKTEKIPIVKPTIITPIINEVKPIPIIEKITDPNPIKEVNLSDKEIEAKMAQLNITQTITPHKPIVPQKPFVPQESWYEKFRKNNPDLEKFVGENLVSKIGIAILVIGIAFFVKFAIDKEWINEIARVGIGILCGVIVLAFAHKLHTKFKAFSSVLVGGGVSIFYFTIGIAFHQYHIFNQTTAFIIMLGITGFSVFTSILYNRMELATLSLIGGFAVPFMVSTGEGNYLVLFTYVLILDVGMLVLAYMRKWNLVNVLAYVFTVLLYFGWLQTKVIGVENASYKGAFIFGVIFYSVFIFMNVINNIKEKRKFGALDLSILISNTFIFYGTGMQILAYYHPELQGLYSLLFGLFNLVCSWLLYKKFSADKNLVYLMIGLTLTFITLAAPVQLHGNYITLFWALEAVLLIWLAQKSGIVLYRFVSVIVTVLMCISLLMDWINVYGHGTYQTVNIIFNKAFITGLVSAFSLAGIVFLLKKETEKVSYLGITFNPINYSMVLKIGFLGILYLTGLLEITFQFAQYLEMYSVLIIAVAYHLVFFAIINLFIKSTSANAILVINFILNYLNTALYVVAFALLPITDFKENLYSENPTNLGFIFHYVSIACVIFMTVKMYQLRHKKDTPIIEMNVLNTILCSIAIVYVSSAELLLHVSKFSIPMLTNTNGAAYDIYYQLYSSIKINVIKIGFPILWGILAFVFLFFGMKKQSKPFRIVALSLLAITLVKLFTYDISNASEAGKIIAFIILGLLLLVISFMYQKIKALLIDETDKKE